MIDMTIRHRTIKDIWGPNVVHKNQQWNCKQKHIKEKKQLTHIRI